MAYWIDSSGGSSRQVSFLMDTDADVNKLPNMTTKGVKQGNDDVSYLPCGRGSSALSVASGEVYILTSNNSWVKIGG